MTAPGVLDVVGRVFGRSRRRVQIEAEGDGYWDRPDVPKAARPSTATREVPPLEDPLRTLGHPPRPRRGRR